MGWVILVVALLFAGGVATSYAEKRFDYSLWDTIRTKVFRQKP